MDLLQSLTGLIALMAIAWLVSSDRRRVKWRVVAGGLALQFLLAWAVIPPNAIGHQIFDFARRAVNVILGFTGQGAKFILGGLAVPPDAGGTYGFIFVFQVLPTIIFFSALMSVLYHLRIMQVVVGVMAWVMRRTLGVSGAESISVAANVFVGQTEAPLVVRPYVTGMTRSELMALMTGGFATIAGGVLVAYVQMGVDAGHLLTASVMSAPAAFVMAKLMVPETETPATLEGGGSAPVETANVIDAAALGAADGMKLAINVAAMLLAFVALIAMVDYGLQRIDPGLSLRAILGWIFAPLAWTMGVPWSECATFGQLLGTKISLNEFVAYLDLGAHIKNHTLGPRAVAIATYALCGFANFSSIAIQLGGIGGIAPTRRADLARLGLRAMFAGAFASWQTAVIAGMFV